MRKNLPFMQRASLPLLTAVLLLNLGAASRTFAQSTYTWNGGGADSNWSTNGNWVGGSAPSTAYNFLHFAGTNNLNATNNLGDYGAGYRIYFDAGAGAFTLGGNAIKFYENGTNAPLIENDSTSLQTIAFRIGVTNPYGLDIKAVTGDMAFTSGNSIFFDYNNNSAPGGIRVDGGTGRTVTFNDALIDGSGSGSLTVGTSGTASTFTTVLKANSTYTGATTVNGGILAIGAGGSLYNGGNNAGAITINSGGTLRFDRNDIFGNSSNTSAVVVTVNAGGTVASNGSINVLRNPVFNGGTLMANGGFVGASIGVGGTVTIGGTQATNFVIGTVTTDDNVIIGQEGLSSSFTTFQVNDVATGSDLVVQMPLQNNFGTSAGLTKNGSGTMELDGANTYNNTTTINAGELLFGQNGNSNSSAIVLGNSSGSAMATLTLGGSSAQTISSAVTVQAGNNGAQIIRSLNTSGASSMTGNVTLQRDVTAAATQAGGTLQFATVVSSDSNTRTVFVGDTNIANAGTVSFTGTTDNTNIGVTVNSGTFLLGKTSGGSVHAVGSALTVNSGGTATLGGSGGDQIQLRRQIPDGGPVGRVVHHRFERGCGRVDPGGRGVAGFRQRREWQHALRRQWRDLGRGHDLHSGLDRHPVHRPRVGHERPAALRVQPEFFDGPVGAGPVLQRRKRRPRFGCDRHHLQRVLRTRPHRCRAGTRYVARGRGIDGPRGLEPAQTPGPTGDAGACLKHVSIE